MASTFPASPSAWLYSWVSGGTGYQTIEIGGTDYTVPAAYQRADHYLDSLDSALSSAGWGVALGSDGQVTLSGSSAPVGFPDRLGAALGFEMPTGWTSASALTSLASTAVSPIAVPLYGATYSQVDIEKESELTLDRQVRGHGYLWGGARIWRIKAVTTRGGLDAIRKGWVTKGKVSLVGGSPSTISGSQPTGSLTGVALGLSGVRWLGPAKNLAEVEILMSQGLTSYSESHYIQFDGISDYAEATITEGSQSLCMVIKAAGPVYTGSTRPLAARLRQGTTYHTVMRRAATTTSAELILFNSSNVPIYARTGSIGSPTTLVMAHWASQNGSDVDIQWHLAADGSVTYSYSNSYASKTLATPNTLRIGTAYSAGQIKLIGCAILRRMPTSTEVAAWSQPGVSPLDVWDPTDLAGAYNASDAALSGSDYLSPDISGNGAPDLIYSSISDSDKVAL